MNASPEEDPLGLERVDQEIRIERLRHQIEETTGVELQGGTAADCRPELEEAFLENVLAMEEHGWSRPFDRLVKDGVVLPHPDELDDAALPAKLWEVILALAAHRYFLHHTNHLGDRELYAHLWSEGLREETMGFGLPFGNCHLDLIGSGSDEDIAIGLRFYDSGEERARWAAQFPDFPIPPRENPPFDRDRHLPQPDYSA